MGVFFIGCQSTKENTNNVRYPDPPNKPPRIPSGPAIVGNQAIPPYPEKDEDDKPKKRKKEGSGKAKPSREKDDDKDRKRKSNRNYHFRDFHR